MNLYGFAAGDPVNYSDPFGLCPIEKDGVPCGGTGAAIGAVVGFATGALLSAGCAGASGGLCALAAPGIVEATTGLGTAIGGAIGTFFDLEHSDEEHAAPPSPPTPGEVADAVGQSGAKVKPHPTRTGEGATIHWPDGSTTDIRVETHPLKPGGPPQLHGNVENRDKNGRLIDNKHILP